MEKFVYVYILVSQANEMIHYTAITRDLQQRLLEHDRGTSPHTSQHWPWRIETAIAFKSENKAQAFEKWIRGEFAGRHL
jgi:putative endonuclease